VIDERFEASVYRRTAVDWNIEEPEVTIPEVIIEVDCTPSVVSFRLVSDILIDVPFQILDLVEDDTEIAFCIFIVAVDAWSSPLDTNVKYE
jgi:hypothetical protein